VTLLSTRSLQVTFGGLVAVDDVDLRVDAGQIVGLIGPNGAGKTTFIDAVTGFVRPSAGEIHFAGRRIDRDPAHRRARAGLARTWQSIELFGDLTVRENLLVASEARRWWTFLSDAVRPDIRGRSDRVDGVLAGLGLTALAERSPDDLSQGERKLVGVARALAAGPQLLCLDEPAAGLDPDESSDLGRRLRGMLSDEVGLLLVDHDMSLVLSICDYVYVLEFGRLIAQGPPEVIRTDDRVITAYLGERARPTEAGRPT
jgi:branched-chain amino acid transport system ATP-binding protein